MGPRDLILECVERFRETNLSVYSSAVAFQLLSALPPLVLAGLAVAGFLDLEEQWTQASFDLRPSLSPASFEVVDSTVRAVLREKQAYWLTVGLALALFSLSGATRAAMRGLSRVYGSVDDRPILVRLRISLALAVALAVLVGGAIAVWRLAPGGLLRWPVVLALLLLASGTVIRYAPATRQPWRWVTHGAVLCVGSWLLATLAFTLYATRIADYGSAFGAFAALFVLMLYVYITAVALFCGSVLDAVLRERAGAEGAEG